MSAPHDSTTIRRKILRPIISRNPDEPHRPATPLELLFDLCFVVAIAQAAGGLHHAFSHGTGAPAILSFALVFFAIWWAWMGFTWFASAFDNDDVVYRLLVLLQIFGLLVLAAGVPRGFEEHDFGMMTLGYVIMRIGLTALWLRAAGSDPGMRKTAYRYAVGIVLCQIGWVALLFIPAEIAVWGWFVLLPAEFCVPIWAERAGPTKWHADHISERYGLLTIIVIGESVLAGTLAIQAALDTTHLGLSLWSVIFGAPIILFAMWWLYFLHPKLDESGANPWAFVWSYGHYMIFASAAAVGSGIAVYVDYSTHVAHLSSFWAGQSLAFPVALFVGLLWFINVVKKQPSSTGYLIAAILCLATPLLPYTPATIAIILTLLTAYCIRKQPHQTSHS